MTLPLYQYFLVPKLKQTWITSITFDPHFMFFKILSVIVNLTTIG